MKALDPVGPAPEARSPRFLLLLAGACIAPIFWLGQMMLGYGVTAHACYSGNHPQAIASAPTLGAMILTFNIIATIAAASGGGVAWWCWRQDPRGVYRFLALWGMFSSLCFFCAIVFNVIASMTVPPCLV
jgi:hypothetical protein